MGSERIVKKKLQSIRGMHDLFDLACQHFLEIVEKARAAAGLYGFQEAMTPLVESREVFERAAETSDVVLKEMFEVVARGTEERDAPPLFSESPMVLRGEGTAPLMRAIVEHGLTQTLPLKLFYAGAMLRYDRPQRGRLRQFHQVGVECVGLAEPWSDVEVLSLAFHFLQSLKIQGEVVLELNTLGDTESYQRFRTRLVAYLTPHKASLSPDSQLRLEKNPLRILDSKNLQDQKILEGAPLLHESLTPEAWRFFERVQEGLAALHIPFQLNPQLVRGLDYYTHTAFEFKAAALGAQSTLLAGGRYDGLCGLLGGPPLPGVGWAAGVERLCLLTSPPEASALACLVMPQAETDQDAAFALAGTLRQRGIPAELFAGPQGLGKRLQRAHKRGYTWVVILGEAERATQTVVVKNLQEGFQETLSRDALIDRLAPLFKVSLLDQEERKTP